ncbi:hypothetical protein AAY473_010109 [Plecturocebus cupreus]
MAPWSSMSSKADVPGEAAPQTNPSRARVPPAWGAYDTSEVRCLYLQPRLLMAEDTRTFRPEGLGPLSSLHTPVLPAHTNQTEQQFFVAEAHQA